jgi:hypothetical protein
MQPYEVRLMTGSTQGRSAAIAVGRDVLERAIGLTFLSLFWGFILFLALTAAVR